MRDVLRRLDGVGDVTLFGLREYMRIWLGPERLAAQSHHSDIVAALQAQNIQLASGVIQPRFPAATPTGFR